MILRSFSETFVLFVSYNISQQSPPMEGMVDVWACSSHLFTIKWFFPRNGPIQHLSVFPFHVQSIQSLGDSYISNSNYSLHIFHNEFLLEAHILLFSFA